MSLFKVPIISATSTTIKDGLQKKEVTFRREVESNQNENTDDAGSTHHEINYSLNDHFWFNKRVSHGPMQIHAYFNFNITDPNLHLKLRSHSH